MTIKGKRPNFLIITTDEERFPPPYENPEAKAYREANSKALGEMRKHGLTFENHHAAATACAPSRTTLYTGQYPSLHGVSQTPGIGKSSFDEGQFWLKPNTVPTLGNYFRQAGYQTWYRGKWHISYEDIDIPGSQMPLMSNDTHGKPYPDRIKLYEEADHLDKYGFSGWIGPEPHGSAQANDGSVRDPGFARQVCDLLENMDRKARAGEDQDPFLLVSSFVNPHDIVFSEIWPWFPEFDAAREKGELPFVAPPPTANEALESKPRAQKDYVLTYPRMYLPQPQDEAYRQFYYYLMAEVNKHIDKVYETLQKTCFADNTIVIFTSDHGDTLGAHGGMQQKWYNAYEEVLHVPFIVSNKHLFPEARTTDLLTSHIDMVPTLLGLAGIDQDIVRKELARNHSEARELVGRDLSALIKGEQELPHKPIYFMTDDNVESGSQMYNRLSGQTFNPVIQPKHLETVITQLPDLTGDTMWKYTRYFDNPRFYSGQVGNPDDIPTARFIPDEFECYNMSEDPLEEDNLLSPLAKKPLDEKIREALAGVMAEQREQKRLLPQTLNRDVSKEDLSPLRD